MTKKLLALGLAAALLSIAGTAGAVTTKTSNFVTQVQIDPACSLQVDNLVFPNSGILDHVITATSNIHLYCTANVAYSISVNDASSKDFYMMADAGLTRLISYGLYQDAAMTTPWNSTSPFLAPASSAGANTVPFYGAIPVQASVPQNAYAQTDIATISY
jgi:spore coat protein U-like protein